MVHSGSDVERLLRDRDLRDHLHFPPRVCRRQQVGHGQLKTTICCQSTFIWADCGHGVWILLGSWLVDPCPLGLPHQVTIYLIDIRWPFSFFSFQLFKLSFLAPTRLCLVRFQMQWCLSQIQNFGVWANFKMTPLRWSLFAETPKDLCKYMSEGFNAPRRQLLRAHSYSRMICWSHFSRDWRDLVFYTSLPSLVSFVLVRVKTLTQNMDVGFSQY